MPSTARHRQPAHFPEAGPELPPEEDWRTHQRLGPWWAEFLIFWAGVVVCFTSGVRRGCLVMAAGLVVGALLRLVLGKAASGGLYTRSRTIDVVMKLLAAAALAVGGMLIRGG